MTVPSEAAARRIRVRIVSGVDPLVLWAVGEGPYGREEAKRILLAEGLAERTEGGYASLTEAGHLLHEALLSLARVHHSEPVDPAPVPKDDAPSVESAMAHMRAEASARGGR